MHYFSPRLIVVYLSLLIAGVYFLIIRAVVPSAQIQIIRLDQGFAFLSLIYLYLALLISPLYTVFSAIPYREKAIQSRRSLGIFCFIFALLHGSFAFFGQLNGFNGVSFLSNDYLLSLIIGFIAFEILMVLALTSFDKAVNYLSFSKWKFIHRFVYLAGILILIHTVLIGTHYLDLSRGIPQVTIILLAFLMILEAIRFDRYLKTKKHFSPRFGISLIVIVFLCLWYSLNSLVPTTPLSLGIHAQHLLLAQQAQNTTQIANSSTIPGLTGDPNLRFTMNFDHDTAIQPGIPTTLHFKVYNANNGDEVKLFSDVYTKLIHLIIVNKSLTYFNHIHPVQTPDGFSITTTFPNNGTYHLYTDFQPYGAIEQQIAFSLVVGNPDALPPSSNHEINKKTKTFGNYKVTLNYPSPLKATELALGQQQITFTLRDGKTGKPITTLKAYLAAFGHLSMINEKTFDFIHVHPTLLTPPAPNSNGGPTINFLPLGLYGPITPGIYRVFAEFNPNNQLFTADFTVQIE